MDFYMGTQGDLRSVKVPSTGLERLRTRFRSSGTLTNGGGWARASVGSHYAYTINWDFIRNAQYASIAEIFEYGDLIHFLDPQAAVSNALPPYVAQAGDAARGGYRMVGYSSTSVLSEIATLAPLVTTGPKRTVRYAGITGAPRKQIWCPIPTGHTMHLRGIAAGTAPVVVTGGSNLLTDPDLRNSTMPVSGGGTYTDIHPSTGGPVNNGWWFRRTVVTANTSSPPGQMSLSNTGTAATPTTPGKTFTVSAYARKTSGGPQFRFDVNWYDAAGAVLSTSVGSPETPGTSWSRYSQSWTVPAGAMFARANLVWTGIALAGQTLDLANAQVEIGELTPWSNGVLPASTASTTVAPVISISPGAESQGVYLTIGAGDQANIRWLQTMVLPTGQTPVWGNWMPGLGHSGCRLDGDPSYTLYSAPQAIDFGALSLPLRETGAWE